ncbi:hypothetical protein ACFSYH_12045 [Populibacterium corticicola]|uniref:Late embryogenesis abundant protein LEA-2 subgroup domain-containing protein n=1 Tax=Populibacterium corticicola TaxID=1812826 RepID=A0ABW5XHY1_9MICO
MIRIEPNLCGPPLATHFCQIVKHAGLLLLVVGAASACSSQGETILENAGFEGVSCLVAGSDDKRLFETTLVMAVESVDIAIEDVTLANPENLQLESFGVVVHGATAPYEGHAVEERPVFPDLPVEVPAGMAASIVATVQLTDPLAEGKADGVEITHRKVGEETERVFEPILGVELVPHGSVCEE